jgi:hypothetical protein
MSYNGSGTFNINSTGQPVVAGTVITASAFNALTADLATGLTTAITKDGQTTTTARIPFAQGISVSQITSAASTSLTLQSAGTTAVTIDTSQNVGIGITPTYKLDVAATSSIVARFARTSFATGYVVNAATETYFSADSSGNNGFGADATNGRLVFWANSAERMRIDSSGNVGIGTTSPTNRFNVKGASGAGEARLDGNSGGAIYTSNGDVQIYTNNSAYSVRFLTATGAAESARFDNSGNLLVGVTSGSQKLIVSNSASSVVGYFINSNATTAYGTQITYTGKTPNNTGEEFIYCNDTSALRMSVRSNGGIANYTANNVILSDRREKTNFSPATSYLDKICAIPVQTFNYIDQNLEEDGGLTLGVVAQDVQAVAPELVTEGNWGTKEEPKMRFEIYQTDLQYALMKSIQELKAINDTQAETINALTARITALENA